MNLIGQPINHTTFGAGVITALVGSTVTVSFGTGEKKFIYPDAFQRFLSLKDQKSQRCIEQQIADREAALRKQRELAQAEQDRRRKAANFKVTPNSHIVFDLAPEQIRRSMETGRVTTGTYLSGYSKGLPRVADRVKPNSVCLLTARPGGQEERARVVLGAFMAAEDFFGEDAQDGVIFGHPQYRIALPEEHQLLFWEYFGSKTPPRWGNVAFKYCCAQGISRMLGDMIGLLPAGDEADKAEEFYRYFCARNHLNPVIGQEEALG